MLVGSPTSWEGPLLTVGVPEGTSGPTTVVVTVHRLPESVPPSWAHAASRWPLANAGAAGDTAKSTATDMAVSVEESRMGGTSRRSVHTGTVGFCHEEVRVLVQTSLGSPRGASRPDRNR